MHTRGRKEKIKRQSVVLRRDGYDPSKRAAIILGGVIAMSIVGVLLMLYPHATTTVLVVIILAGLATRVFCAVSRSGIFRSIS